MTHRVEAGDKAPAFTVPVTSGETTSLKDFRGSPLVLFFYPKDDTETCTKEALAFNEKQQALKRKGAFLLGISRDSIASHAKFISKYGLRFPLASDEDGKVCEAYGVWQEKKLYGRVYMGIERSTFVIDAKGVIRAGWRNVRLKGHVEAVLEAINAL